MDGALVGSEIRGLRPNYSCGSLAAAEQLEALMHHPTQPHGLSEQHQRQLYVASAALGGLYGGMEAGAAGLAGGTTPTCGQARGGSGSFSCGHGAEAANDYPHEVDFAAVRTCAASKSNV